MKWKKQKPENCSQSEASLNQHFAHKISNFFLGATRQVFL